MNEIIASLKSSDLRLAGEVLNKIQDGWVMNQNSGERTVSLRNLYSTYSVRANHLSLQTSDHGKQLYSSTNEFLNNVREHQDKYCTVHTLSGDLEHHYLIFVESEAFNILGVMRVFSQLDVSEEKWRSLWSPP